MVAERIEGRDRHRIDGVGTDQFLDIEHVAIGLVLGAGRRPQEPLRLGATRGKRLPALASEQAQIALIGELGIGDRYRALQTAEPGLLVGVVGRCDFLVEQFVDCGVDAADEEARDTCYTGHVAALPGERFETRQISLDDLFVDLLREQQRDVDVDAVGDQIADRRQALGCRRHFDHEVRTIDRVPQALGFGDRGFGLLRQIGRDLDADKAVGAAAFLEHRKEHVGRLLDVLDRELFVNLAGRAVARLQQPPDR